MKFTLAALQFDIKTADLKANIDTVSRLIEKALKYKARAIALPEMWSIGFAYKGDFKKLAESGFDETFDFLKSTAKKENIVILGGSIPRKERQGVSNTSFIFEAGGNVAGSYSKAHLFSPSMEDKYFAAGEKAETIKTSLFKAGIAICYDLRFPELSRKYALEGAEIIFCPAQFPDPKKDHWITLLKARAIENQLFAVGVNRVGKTRDLEFFGRSMIIDPFGKALEEAGGKEEVIVAEIDLSEIKKIREQTPVFEHRRNKLYNETK